MSKPHQTPRIVALQALLRVEQDAGYSNIVLDKALENSGLSERDKALAAAIFYGVLEKRLTLDYYIEKCLSDPGRKPDRTALEAIRCGVYQILYMNRVPDSAAVNETVQAVKVMGKANLVGFVNGVLRGLIRRKEQIKLPKDDSLYALSIRYSIPEGLIRLWMDGYGEQTTLRLLESLTEKPKLFIRVNRTKCSREDLELSLNENGIKILPLQDLPYAAALENCGAPDALSQFRQGMFHVQDISAQRVCQILDPQPGEIICDCCAAPGGKTFTIAQEVGSNGRVFSLDLYKNRVRLIENGAKRLGLTNIEARANDALMGFEGIPPVDKMLCDVPCSGFGVIQRKPEIRYKDIGTLKDLPKLQYQILQNASKCVKPGGLLVYSTCTLNPAENNEVAEKFLQENNGFEPIKNIDTGVRRTVAEPGHMLTMMPFAGASDGFFVAAFRKKDRTGADN